MHVITIFYLLFYYFYMEDWWKSLRLMITYVYYWKISTTERWGSYGSLSTEIYSSKLKNIIIEFIMKRLAWKSVRLEYLCQWISQNNHWNSYFIQLIASHYLHINIWYIYIENSLKGQASVELIASNEIKSPFKWYPNFPINLIISKHESTLK